MSEKNKSSYTNTISNGFNTIFNVYDNLFRSYSLYPFNIHWKMMPNNVAVYDVVGDGDFGNDCAD